MVKKCRICGSNFETPATIRDRAGKCKKCRNSIERTKYALSLRKEGREVNEFNVLLLQGLKKCKKCLSVKCVNEFSSCKVKHGLRSVCKACESVYSKLYSEKNKEKINEKRRERRKDPIRGIIFTQRDRQRSLFKGNKICKRKAATNTIREWMGCSVIDCKLYLEGKFLSGMNWNNRGVGESFWQIDHIIPISLTHIDESGEIVDNELNRKIWHYTNLQPLWHVDNAKKSNKYESTIKLSVAV